MTRNLRHSSRRQGPTEREIRLQWEIDRLRAELTGLRKSIGANEFGELPGDRLQGESMARFYEKLGRLMRNLLGQWVDPEDRCAQCGGLPPDTQEQAFRLAADQIRAGVPDATISQIALPDWKGRDAPARTG